MEINGTSNVVYKDYPLYKKLTNGGELKVSEDSEALTQAVKIWLTSDKGEKVRNLGGGIITPYIGSIMDNSTAKDMEIAIRKALTEEFKPSIEVVYLNVEPNKEKNQWIIHLAGFNAQLAVGINTDVIVKNI